jgi:hypothetical protein
MSDSVNEPLSIESVQSQSLPNQTEQNTLKLIFDITRIMFLDIWKDKPSTNYLLEILQILKYPFEMYMKLNHSERLVILGVLIIFLWPLLVGLIFSAIPILVFISIFYFIQFGYKVMYSHIEEVLNELDIHLT